MINSLLLPGLIRMYRRRLSRTQGFQLFGLMPIIILHCYPWQLAPIFQSAYILYPALPVDDALQQAVRSKAMLRVHVSAIRPRSLRCNSSFSVKNHTWLVHYLSEITLTSRRIIETDFLVLATSLQTVWFLATRIHDRAWWVGAWINSNYLGLQLWHDLWKLRLAVRIWKTRWAQSTLWRIWKLYWPQRLLRTAWYHTLVFLLFHFVRRHYFHRPRDLSDARHGLLRAIYCLRDHFAHFWHVFVWLALLWAGRQWSRRLLLWNFGQVLLMDLW